jgi:hypothetical protein
MFTARWRDGMEWNLLFLLLFFPNLILGFVNPGELEQLYSALAMECSPHLHDCILRNFHCELYAYFTTGTAYFTYYSVEQKRKEKRGKEREARRKRFVIVASFHSKWYYLYFILVSFQRPTSPRIHTHVHTHILEYTKLETPHA